MEEICGKSINSFAINLLQIIIMPQICYKDSNILGNTFWSSIKTLHDNDGNNN